MNQISQNRGRRKLLRISAGQVLRLVLLLLLLSACQPTATETPSPITISILSDGETHQVTLPAGSTVQNALEAAGISLGSLDRVSPPAYAVLEDGAQVTVTRVREEYLTRTEPIPFRSYLLPNESMPANEKRLIQAGENGEQEITTRITYEDGIKVSEIDLAPVIIKQPVDEILMVGVQNPFTTVSIPGRLAYLSGGNAWLMEGSTANRRPIVTSGDLDGRVFRLSPDGEWLLFSRKSSRPAEQEINTLWIVNVNKPGATPVNLHVANVVHFADWQPGQKYVITYSTVEPRLTAPGWQANNDLYLLPFDPQKGSAGTPTKVLETSSGGIYGWWGTTFAWSPDGQRLAYARPDSVGLVDLEAQTLFPLVEITPLNTYADWAWVPGLAWGSDSQSLYFVTHAPPQGLTTPEESPLFDLQALSLTTGINVSLALQTGMFAYPSCSAAQTTNGEIAYQVAYLQAIFPQQSATSRYRLTVMDRDGSDPRQLFPPATQPGLEPQTPVWSPQAGSNLIAILYEGNLWLIDAQNVQSQQITGDGLTIRVDWK